MSYRSRSEPFNDGAEVTPSDSTVLSPTPRGLTVLEAGDVVIELLSGNVLTFVDAPACAVIHYANIKKVKAATTATVATGY